MKWRNDGSIETAAQLSVVVAFVFGFSIWIASHHLMGEETIWLFLMLIVAVAMRVDGNVARRDLAETLKEWREERKRDGADYAMEVLEACRVRRDMRAAVRAGLMSDDGLSEFGRNLAEIPTLLENSFPI